MPRVTQTLTQYSKPFYVSFGATAENARILRKAADDSWTYKPGDRDREFLPEPNRGSIPGILRIELRKGTAIGEPIIPVELLGFRAPLRFEFVRPRIDRRPAEIEESVPFLACET